MRDAGEPDRSTRLREIPGIRQHEGEPHRRWFSCASADLYVWQDDEGRLTSFELCYDKPGDEHALRWRADVGFEHTRIDDGEHSPFKNHTPIIVSGGRFDMADLALMFEVIGGEIDPSLYRLVLAKLHLAS